MLAAALRGSFISAAATATSGSGADHRSHEFMYDARAFVSSPSCTERTIAPSDVSNQTAPHRLHIGRERESE